MNFRVGALHSCVSFRQWRMSVPNPGKVVAKRARPETTAGSLGSRGRQQKVLYRSDNKTPLSVDCVRYQVMRPEECLEFDRDLTEISGSQLEMSRCRRQAASAERLHACGNPEPRNGTDAITGDRHSGYVRRLAEIFGAGDRTRTGKPIKAADFRHTASFKAGVAKTTPFVRWTMPSPSRAGVLRCPCALGAPRLVSTPSSRALRREAWLGVASMRVAHQGFRRI